jgi:hypothetical protein
MAEIGAMKAVWDAKINLCWWHLRRAVRTRLAKTKLSTSPYNLDRAMAEYDFIKSEFIPAGTRVDINDYEGGILDEPPITSQPPSTAPKAASLPVSSSSAPNPHEPPENKPRMPLGNILRIKLPLPSITSAIGRVIRGEGFRLSIPGTHLPITEERDVNERTQESAVSVYGEDEEEEGQRTFCPLLYRESIISMMEKHYCAHPTIPGSSRPDARSIKKWAVQRVYNFCSKHELPDVWVYLWENWYREGRWELWARCTHKIIPVLKTTMILESQ